MKSRIRFFKDSQFKSDDSEAAAIFSILMDTEFQQHSKLKNDFLKIRLIIAGVIALVGLALLFIPIYPIAAILLAGAVGATFYFYQQYQNLNIHRYIHQMGKFHWKISLFPYRNGCVAIDDSGFHDIVDLQFPFIDNKHTESLEAQRQEFLKMAGNQDLFWDEFDKGDDSKPFAYYGLEKRIKEILENSHTLLEQHKEKTASGPLLSITSSIDANITEILKNLEPYSSDNAENIVCVQEYDAEGTYESLIQMDTFLNKNKETGLADTLDGWIEELKEYLNNRHRNISKKALIDFRKEFLSHCASPGYNHYCPECNKNYTGNPDDLPTFTFDENSRMTLKLPGKWQCPVCGHTTPNPITIPRVYDEVIFPVTRLLMLEEKDETQREILINQILSPEFDHRLHHNKVAGVETFSRVFDEVDHALAQTKSERFAELVQKLENSIDNILEKRRQLEETLETFKVDLSIPGALQIFLPFYLVKYGGENGNQEFQVITPSSLVKSQDSESAVNYKFDQDNIYGAVRDTIYEKMRDLLKDKKYRVEAIKDQKQISRGMQKIKDTDFYSEKRYQFFDLIDKTYFQAQEN